MSSMSIVGEMSFRDIRYKELERSLKLELLRKKTDMAMNSSNAASFAKWPSMSTINADVSDFSCMNRASPISRNHSEVLASSNNLKDAVLKRKFTNTDNQTTTTFSINQNAIREDEIKKMPPPKLNYIPRALKQTDCNLRTTPNNTQGCSIIQNNVCASNDISCNSTESLYAPNANTKTIRVFSKWTVMLNPEGQIIIKGILESGKLVRSKPVIRRITATHVQSMFKHTYLLKGPIVDERNVLPDYIRGKFYNGFPYDWENIHQIWQTFVRQSCKLNFRWPTFMMDTDDDIKTEITEFSMCYKHNNKQKNLNPEYASRTCNSGIDKSKTSLNFPQKYVKNSCCCCCSEKREKNDSFTQTYENVMHTIADSTAEIEQCNKENLSQSQNIHLNKESMVHNKIKLIDVIREDKLDVIVNNLRDKNCSHEYIHKIIEMFDCMNYVVSYKPSPKTDASVSEARIQQTDLNLQEYQPHNNTSKQYTLKESEHRVESLCNNIQLENNSSLQNYNSSETSITHKNQCNNEQQFETSENGSCDQSESETYTGIPRVSIARVFSGRKRITRPYKYKGRKRNLHPTTLNCNLIGKQEDTNLPKSYTHVQRTMNKEDFHESLSSCSEEEIESDVKKNVTSGSKHALQETFSIPHPVQENKKMCLRENVCAVLAKHKVKGTNTHISEESETTDHLSVSVVEDRRIIQEHMISQPSNMQHMHTIAQNTETKETVGSLKKNNKEMKKLESTPKSISSNSCEHENLAQHKSPNTSVRNTRLRAISSMRLKNFKPDIISSVQPGRQYKLKKEGVACKNLHNTNVNNLETSCPETDSQAIDNENTVKNKSSPIEQPMITKETSLVHSSGDRKKMNLMHEFNVMASVQRTNSDIGTKSGIDKSENLKNGEYGSEQNPKLLTGWVPKVECDSKLLLVFEGKLLNEMGHIIQTKFTTDPVLRRVSATLIETVTHQFYQLVGSLNATEKALPKELLKQCRNGCPSKVDQFCKTWKLLQTDIKESQHNTTLDSLSVPVSSRGRRILPPLNYWTGERITLKDNNLTYTPGNCQENSLCSPQNNTDIIGSSTISPNKKIVHNFTSCGSKKHRTPSLNCKRKIEQQLKYSSSDTSDEETELLYYSQPCEEDIKTRKRQKLDCSSNKMAYTDQTRLKYSTMQQSLKKKHNHNAMYYQNIPSQDDILSDDQLSYI